MKKLLALVLALVMTLGLATVSSSAAYSDKADIEYTEAADVMTALGVFQGKGDAFAPKDNLNRAEAAKLIAYLMLGNKTAESMTGSGTRFTDVPASHWAAGFIEYLASVGIVSGVGNNQFNPNGQVTAVQFAKMLLVALGYDADLEGFVGEGWSINIQKLANKNDLFDTLDVSSNDALTREQAAQMCLNDLKADMVKYSDKGTTVKIGESTVVTGAKEAAKDEDVGNKNYNHSTDANGDRKYLQLAESLYGNDIDLRVGTDDFGRPTNTWNYKNIKVGEYADNAQLIATATAKFSKKSLYDALGKDQYDNIKDGKTALYVYNDGVGSQVAASSVDSYMDSSDTTALNGTGNGSLTQVYLNEDGSNDVVRVVTSHTYVWQVANDYSASRGDITIKNVGDATNNGTGVLPNDHVITLKDRVLKDDDFELVKDLKKDDYVLVTAYRTSSTASYEVDSIAKAEIKTGKVDSFTKADTVTIDGTKLKYSKMAPENDEQKGATYTVGESASLVMDKYGYVIAVDEAVVNDNYVFIANIASTSGLNSNPEADAYFTDGTNETVRINKLNNSDSKTTILGTPGTLPVSAIGAFSGVNGNVTSHNAGWYTYSKASNDKYNLSNISSSYRQAAYIFDTATPGADIDDVITSNKVNFMASADAGAPYAGVAVADTDLYRMVATTPASSSLKANNDTVFVVEQDGDVNVYTGLKNAPGVSLKASNNDAAVVVVLYDNSNSYAKYVYVTLTADAEVDGGQNTALLYVLKRDTSDVIADQKDYEMWYVINADGKAELVKTETRFNYDSVTNSTDGYRAYYKAFKNSDDEYTKVSIIDSTDDGVIRAGSNDHYFEGGSIIYDDTINTQNAITFNKGSLYVGGEGFVVDDSTKIYLVMSKSFVDASGKKIATALMANPDNNYEIEAYGLTTGDVLEQRFIDCTYYEYNVQGRIGGDFTDNDADLKEIYITLTEVVKPATSSSSSTSTTSRSISRADYDSDDAFITALNNLLDSGNATVTNNSVTFPAGSYVNIPLGRTLTVNSLSNYGNVTVDGTLVVNGNLTDAGHIVDNGTLTVAGTNNRISGNSLVIAEGAVAQFTNANAKVTVLGNLTNNGTLTIGEAGKTTAALIISGENAAVTFGAASETEVQGDLTAADTVGADKIEIEGNVVVAKDLDVADDQVKAVTTGTVAVGGSQTEAITNEDGDEVSATDALAVAKNEAKKKVDEAEKAWTSYSYVKKYMGEDSISSAKSAFESKVEAAKAAIDEGSSKSGIERAVDANAVTMKDIATTGLALQKATAKAAIAAVMESDDRTDAFMSLGSDFSDVSGYSAVETAGTAVTTAISAAEEAIDNGQTASAVDAAYTKGLANVQKLFATLVSKSETFALNAAKSVLAANEDEPVTVENTAEQLGGLYLKIEEAVETVLTQFADLVEVDCSQSFTASNVLTDAETHKEYVNATVKLTCGAATGSAIVKIVLGSE